MKPKFVFTALLAAGLIVPLSAHAGILPDLICEVVNPAHDLAPQTVSIAWNAAYSLEASTTLSSAPYCPTFDSVYEQDYSQSTRVTATFVTALKAPVHAFPVALVSITEANDTTKPGTVNFSGTLEVAPGTRNSKNFDLKCLPAHLVPPQYTRVACNPNP